jgi:hypothetical protein
MSCHLTFVREPRDYEWAYAQIARGLTLALMT